MELPDDAANEWAVQLEIAELTRLATRALAIESNSRRINVEMLVWQRARGRAKEMLKIVTCVKLLVERGANVNEQAGEYLARIIFVRLLE